MQATIEKTQLVNSQLTKKGQKKNVNVKERTAIFESEFMPHLDTMYNFAFRLTYDEDDAKDLYRIPILRLTVLLNLFKKGRMPRLGSIEF